LASTSYCAMPAHNGLTCSWENLVLLRKLSEDESAASTNIIFLYQCKLCHGLYKYIYASRFQTRNFDAEEGWDVYDDHYYKVGERSGAGSVQFPLREARIYGYQGDDIP